MYLYLIIQLLSLSKSERTNYTIYDNKCLFAYFILYYYVNRGIEEVGNL